jgi:hypothetical protein
VNINPDIAAYLVVFSFVVFLIYPILHNELLGLCLLVIMVLAVIFIINVLWWAVSHILGGGV